MGIDQSFYFGPFVKCSYDTKPVFKTVFFCEQTLDHKVKGKHQFCPACGSKVLSREVTTDEKSPNIDLDAIESSLGGRLMDVWSNCGHLGEEGYHYYQSNLTKDGIKRTSTYGKYETGIVELCADDIIKEIELFSSFFAKELKTLHAHYKQVVVTWGVISSCS